MFNNTQVIEKETILVEDKIKKATDLWRIIVWNDDVNTFDWVIKSFMDICRHNSQQAEQLSMIVHFKGKAIVKTGPKKELRPMKEGLIDRGINATMESDA